jgi:hypothetical protein
MLDPVAERFDAIEACYEFMLAYAAQGLPTDQGRESGGQLRQYLRRAAVAIDGLTEACRAAVAAESLELRARYEAFFAILERDAGASLAALELVLAQPGISSQLIDNLNASIHIRALLTDIFLIDEIFNGSRSASGIAVPA